MAIKPVQAAKKICELGDWNVTNLQLQKILYLIHMVYMGRNSGKPLIDSSFEAWDYGPVIPSIYHKVKIYGDQPIGNIFSRVENLCNPKELEAIEEGCEHLLEEPPGKLVSFTHRPGGAWDKNYVPGVRGIQIPNGDILSEYRSFTVAG